jgi:hypothetical protein
MQGPSRHFLKRLGILSLSAILAVVVYLGMAKQQSIANTQTPIPQLAQLGPAWVPAMAQASVTPVTRQGSQVVVNGRSLAIVWSERQNKIGIADSGLKQGLGIDLLGSNEVTAQPVEWFSDQRTDSLVLPTWLTQQFRFLDISPLIERGGWQWQVNGNVLRINTPTATVKSVRQGRQDWGDRIVIDLDQPTTWQVTEADKSLTVTLDAQLDPTLLRSFRGRRGNSISALRLQTDSNHTVIQIGLSRSKRSRVWSVPNPNRLLIDVGGDALVNREIAWAPGIRWRQQLVAIASGKFPVMTLEVDPRQSGVRLKPIVSNPTSAVGTAPLLTTAQRSQVAAAINGGYFNRNTQLPLGAVRRDGDWLSGPILNRGAIGWNDDGTFLVGRLTLQETLTTSTGQQFQIRSLNSGFVGAGVDRYTPAWGRSYKNILNNEVIATVQAGQVISLQQARAAGRTTVLIPEDGYLLVIREDRDAVNALPTGTAVEIAISTFPGEFENYSHIMGGGPVLIQDQRIVLNAGAEQFSAAFSRQAAARSVIGISSEGNLMLTVVHHRINGAGPTLSEMAQILQQMGAMHALNLDGGSSTTLYLGGQLLDRGPSTAARVHNGIGVFIQPSS